jgi:hypothetical protein
MPLWRGFAIRAIQYCYRFWPDNINKIEIIALIYFHLYFTFGIGYTNVGQLYGHGLQIRASGGSSIFHLLAHGIWRFLAPRFILKQL